MGAPPSVVRRSGDTDAPVPPAWPAAPRTPTRSVRLGPRTYPVVLPTVRDPRLHLAAVIVSLQVLGQTVLEFELSIAQILLAIGTSALIEATITFRRDGVIAWPASALLTGNGVAFILRVPGTEHGDWWSLRGAWIFVAAAALSVASKHLIRVGGRHLFNPSNFGLVVVFLALGSSRAEPLDFWWGPMSPGLALALAVIVVGGLAILSRLRMLGVAIAFWATFAAGLGVLALSGHCMTARWHPGPICDGHFWRVLVTSPEIMVFLFFMITDPRTAPLGRVARLVYSVLIAALAVVLIAPLDTEFGAKVAVLGALAIVCALRPVLERALPAPGTPEDRPGAWVAGRLGRPADPGSTPRGRAGRVGVAGRAGLGVVVAAAFAGLVVVAGTPAREVDPERAAGVGVDPGSGPGTFIVPAPRPDVAVDPDDIPPVRVADDRFSSQIDDDTARTIAIDLLAGFEIQARALRERDPALAAAAANRAWLDGLHETIVEAEATGRIEVPSYDVDEMIVSVALRSGQAAPAILVTLRGTEEVVTYTTDGPDLDEEVRRRPLDTTLEVQWSRQHYLISTDEPPEGWEPPA